MGSALACLRNRALRRCGARRRLGSWSLAGVGRCGCRRDLRLAHLLGAHYRDATSKSIDTHVCASMIQPPDIFYLAFQDCTSQDLEAEVVGGGLSRILFTVARMPWAYNIQERMVMNKKLCRYTKSRLSVASCSRTLAECWLANSAPVPQHFLHHHHSRISSILLCALCHVIHI